MLKRLLIGCLLVLFALEAWGQGVNIEGSAKIFSLQSQTRFTQNGAEFNFADDLGIPSKSVAGEIGIAAMIGRDFRVKYAFLLPQNKEGQGSLLNQVTLNKITFGPKDTKDPKPEPASSEFWTASHRFEVDYILRFSTLIAPAVFGEYTTSSWKLKGKPVDTQTTNGKASSGASGEIIEASDSFRKFFIGAGATGFYRNRALLTKYEIGYLTNSGKGGMFADVNIRYDWRNVFAGVGYRYRQAAVSFADGDLTRQYQGIYGEVGLEF